MTLKDELHLLLTGKMLSARGYAAVFAAGAVVGAVLALWVWR